MTLGTLSPAQAQFAADVSSATGLAPSVLATWIGAESGWGTTKPGSNYLNIGPGVTYPTVTQAAAATASLITSSPNYTGIVSAAKSGDPAAQIAAIEASPWDTSHYGGQLGALYQQVAAAPVAVAGQPTLTGLTWKDLFLPYAIGQAAGGAGAALAHGANHAVKSAVSGVLSSAGLQKALLTVAFVVGGLGLVVLGLARIFPGVSRTVTSAVTGAGKLAAA